jgi:hypothetical protein
MANQTGIAIVIKAFLPTGKSLDEQFAALSIVKTAHETGDYSALLKAAKIEVVGTEQKTRRIETGPDTDGQAGEDGQTKPDPEAKAVDDAAQAMAEAEGRKPADDADVPAFLKNNKKTKAA